MTEDSHVNGQLDPQDPQDNAHDANVGVPPEAVTKVLAAELVSLVDVIASLVDAVDDLRAEFAVANASLALAAITREPKALRKKAKGKVGRPRKKRKYTRRQPVL